MKSSAGSLVVVGTGIKFMSHLSAEAMVYIKESDIVLYSVNDPIMQAWIKKNNKNTMSLDSATKQYSHRLQCYYDVTNLILSKVREGMHVCVVFYGHPTVFATSALEAAISAKKEGFYSKILPGISAEDCLFADLFIDPASSGCQSYEATDLLIYKRYVNSFSHLILWQVGIIGALGSIDKHNNKNGITLLFNYLVKYYDASHSVILYEASLYPYVNPVIQKYTLNQLPEIKLSSLSTLYIPPARKAEVDIAVLSELGITMNNIYSSGTVR